MWPGSRRAPRSNLWQALFVCLWWAVCPPCAAQDAADPSLAAEGFERRPLRDVLAEVHRATDRRFLVTDEDIAKRRVWFYPEGELLDDTPIAELTDEDRDRIYLILQRKLERQEIALVPFVEQGVQFVQVISSRHSDVKLTDFVDPDDIDRIQGTRKHATVVWPLNHIRDGLKIHQQLRSITTRATQKLQIIGIENEPFVFLSGPGQEVYRIARTISKMDIAPEPPEVVVIRIRNGPVDEIVKILATVYELDQPAGDSVRSVDVKIQAHQSSNSLVLSGSEAIVADIERLVSELDVR
ncbi:MAG: secretin N-terminal domain-containing protein [Acidobacteriota bacterium]